MKIKELLREDDEGNDNSLQLRLTGLLSQLKGRLEDTGANSRISLTALLRNLNDSGINIEAHQFRDMVSKPPLKNIIANVQGDDVVFLGQPNSDDQDSALEPEQNTKTLKRMADRAKNKRD